MEIGVNLVGLEATVQSYGMNLWNDLIQSDPLSIRVME